MTEALIVIGSILAMTVLAAVIRRIFKINICPICAGVSLTWAWLLFGIYSNLLLTTHYLLLTSILMGGSVVGIAYQLVKKIRPEKIMLWKALFIPIGFLVVYGLLNFLWLVAGISLLALALIYFWLKTRKPLNKTVADHVQELQNKMKDCC